jgi:hypothetical protein
LPLREDSVALNTQRVHLEYVCPPTIAKRIEVQEYLIVVSNFFAFCEVSPHALSVVFTPKDDVQILVVVRHEGLHGLTCRRAVSGFPLPEVADNGGFGNRAIEHVREPGRRRNARNRQHKSTSGDALSYRIGISVGRLRHHQRSGAKLHGGQTREKPRDGVRAHSGLLVLGCRR